MKGVFFTDANHGWAVGDSGTILSFTNGTWTKVVLPAAAANLNFTSVTGYIKKAEAKKPIAIYAVTDNGQIWYFTNTSNWQQVQRLNRTSRRGELLNTGTAINVVGAAFSMWDFWIGQAAANTDVQWVFKSGRSQFWQTPDNWKDVAANNGGSPSFGAVSGLSGTDKDHLWIVGRNGRIDYLNRNAKPPIWRMQSMGNAPLNGIVMTGNAGPPRVQLEETTSPNSGSSGATYLSVTANNFPEGDFIPVNLVVTLASDCHGDISAITSALSVVSVDGHSKIVSFLLPRGLDPGQYYIGISDYADGDANFESSNCSVVNIVK